MCTEPTALYERTSNRPPFLRSFSNVFHTPIEHAHELVVGQSLVEALIDGFEDDIDFGSRLDARFRQTSKVLAAPAFEPVAHDGLPDFTRGRDPEPNFTGFVYPVVQQEPVHRPMSSAVLFEIKKFGVPLETRGTISHRPRRQGAYGLSRDGRRGLFVHLWWPCASGNRGWFYVSYWKADRFFSSLLQTLTTQQDVNELYIRGCLLLNHEICGGRINHTGVGGSTLETAPPACYIPVRYLT